MEGLTRRDRLPPTAGLPDPDQLIQSNEPTIPPEFASPAIRAMPSLAGIAVSGQAPADTALAEVVVPSATAASAEAAWIATVQTTPSGHAPAPQNHVVSGHVPYELARQASEQIARSVAHASDRAVEVSLAPEELGKVRMTLQTQLSSILVAIHADRPETVDLLRRNIDMLARDFRDLGYSDVSFSFGGQTGSDTSAYRPPPEFETPAYRAETEPPARFATAARVTQTAVRDSAVGLDLRM